MRLNKILYKTLAVLLACLFMTGTAADCFSKPVDTYRSSSVLADGRWARVREIGRASCRERVCQYV